MCVSTATLAVYSKKRERERVVERDLNGKRRERLRLPALLIRCCLPLFFLFFLPISANSTRRSVVHFARFTFHCACGCVPMYTCINSIYNIYLFVLITSVLIVCVCVCECYLLLQLTAHKVSSCCLSNAQNFRF